MSTMSTIDIATWSEPSAGHRVATLPQRQWLTTMRLMHTTGEPVEVRTGDDEESGVIVLGGTHDLEAASGSWAARGLRAGPFEGRPVALFLPPKTPFRASNGEGDLLLVSARRPEPPAPTPAEPPARKPLLPLAGSNKAFDSATGTWQPIESFPDSAEAILPRRIEAREVDGVRTERIFPVEYKTAGLCLLEAVLAPGQRLTVPSKDRVGAFPDEWAAYYRTEGDLEIDGHTLSGDGVVSGTADTTVTAITGACYVVVAYAGPKPF